MVNIKRFGARLTFLVPLFVAWPGLLFGYVSVMISYFVSYSLA